MQLKFKRKHKILAGIFLFIFLLLFFLSSVVKYIVNKDGEKYSGRKIHLEELHFNYLKLAVKAENLSVYESNGKDLFLSLEQLYVNFEPWKLLNNEYALSELRLVSPHITVIQSQKGFNFDDLAQSEEGEEEAQDSVPEEKEELKFSIRNIKLIDGRVQYQDRVVDNHIDMQDLNLQVPEIAWNNKESNMGVEFSLGNKGHVSLAARVDHARESYGVDIKTSDINIDFISNYLKDYLNLQALNGFFSSELFLKGDMNHVADIFVTGSTRLNDFKMTASDGKELIRTKGLEVTLDSIDLKNSHFKIGQIRIQQPAVHVSLLKDNTNWEQFLAPSLQSDSLANPQDSVKAVETDTVPAPTYSIGKILLEDGAILFADHTLNRPFSYDLTAINASVESITDTATNIPVKCRFQLNGKGEFETEGRFNLVQPFDMDLKGYIKNLDLLSFSPYSEYYIASPITQGRLHYNYSVNMTPQKLRNENQIRINELEFGKRTKDKTATKLPVKLALYVIKDKDDNIEIDLPVKGNPSEPGFRLGPIIWKTLSKFIVKTAAQPFGALSKLVGTNPEEIEALPFDYLQDSLSNKQIRILDNIAKILQRKPDLVFSFSQHTNYEYERAQLAMHKAWEQYLSEQQSGDMQSLPEFSEQHPGFLSYLQSKVPETTPLSTAERSLKGIGVENANKAMEELIEKRNQMVRDYLQNVKEIQPEAIKVETADLRNLPEELKRSTFKIEVSVK